MTKKFIINLLKEIVQNMDDEERRIVQEELRRTPARDTTSPETCLFPDGAAVTNEPEAAHHIMNRVMTKSIINRRSYIKAHGELVSGDYRPLGAVAGDLEGLPDWRLEYDKDPAYWAEVTKASHRATSDFNNRNGTKHFEGKGLPVSPTNVGTVIWMMDEKWPDRKALTRRFVTMASKNDTSEPYVYSFLSVVRAFMADGGGMADADLIREFKKYAEFYIIKNMKI